MKKLIVSLIVLGLVGSAYGWGPTEDVVITDTQVLGASSELGISTYDFATLTINSGGSLTASRLYQGYGAGDTVTVNAGGTLHCTSLMNIGYDYDSTFTQNGGLVQGDNWLGIGRSGSGTYNMKGGLLLLNDDDSAPTATGILYMPPIGSYAGVLNYSGGTIEINQENWSASGYDILSQSWFNDLSSGALVTWDGDHTLISSGIVVGTVTNLNDPMTVQEEDPDGTAVQFEVVLNGDPPVIAGDTITVIVDPNGDGGDVDVTVNGSATPITLTFTDSNWDTPQTVTVKAIDDAYQDSGYLEVDQISLLAISTLGDPNFGGPVSDPNFTGGVFAGAPVSITIIDDESPAIVISKTSLTVSEDGTTDSYTIELQSDPVSPVTVYVGGTGTDASDPNKPDSLPCQVTLNSAGLATLTFSAGDLGPKTVTVDPIDDGFPEVSPHALTLGHKIFTDDPDYSNAIIPNVAVSITDNDARAWSFGDDVALTVDNFSFEDPILPDGGVADFGPGNPIPDYEFWSVGQLQIIDPNAAEWAATYTAGHQQAPDGDQILYMAPVEPYSGVGFAYDVCEYLIEPGPVSYTFEVSAGLPLPAEPDPSLVIYVSGNDPVFGRVIQIDVTDQLQAGEWVEIKVCGVVAADDALIGSELSVEVAGQGVQIDNWRFTVGNHPCPGCTLALDDELLAMDFDGDCKVTLTDFAAFAADWLDCYVYPECVDSW